MPHDEFQMVHKMHIDQDLQDLKDMNELNYERKKLRELELEAEMKDVNIGRRNKSRDRLKYRTKYSPSDRAQHFNIIPDRVILKDGNFRADNESLSTNVPLFDETVKIKDFEYNHDFIRNHSQSSKKFKKINQIEPNFSKGFSTTIIHHEEESPDGQSYSFEKTIFTLRGPETGGVTERQRAILEDQVEQQILESQALVNELLESNKKHAKKLHETLTGLSLDTDFVTPPKEKLNRLRERSTAESYNQFY